MTSERDSMSCNMNDRVAAHASGEPDEELARHLPGCAACRAELDALRTLLRGVRESAPRPQVDDAMWLDFGRAVRVGVEDGAARRRRRLRWLAAALPLALAGAVALTLALRGEGAGAPAGEPDRPVVAEDEAPPRPPVATPAELGPLDVEDVEDPEELADVLAVLEEEDDLPEEDEPELEPIAYGPVDLVEDLDEDELSRVEDAL